MDAVMDLDMTDAEAEALLTEDPERQDTAVSRETVEADPEAPYGRFKNGRPRKSGPRLKRSPVAPVAPSRPAAPSRKPSRAKSGSPDYHQLCREFIAVPEGIVVVLAASKAAQAKTEAQQEAAEKLAADALTVSMYADSLAGVGAKMAVADSRIAAALESVAKGSPLVEGLLVVIPFVMQLGANHGRVKPIEALGVVSRETLLEGAKK
jgi:hypothetical protein